MRRRLRRLLPVRRRPCQNCREADCRCLPLGAAWLRDLSEGTVRPAVRAGRQAAGHVAERVRQVQVRAWQPAGEIYSSI